MEREFDALACDFDGTLAHDGIVSERTIVALERAKAVGLRLLMVTGRELPSLDATFSRTDLFERIVAENGAVLYSPATKTTRVLAPAPPPNLLEQLTQRGVPFSLGHCIVATVQPYEHQVLEAIRELELEWHVIFNKGAVMILPATVTKATGVQPALEELDIEARRTIGIGDAENDHAFLAACGFKVAVANALNGLKKSVDLVTRGDHGAGVEELVEHILQGTLSRSTNAAQRRVHGLGV